MASKLSMVGPEAVEQAIYLVRGQKVMLDSELAGLYAVEARALNQAVKRNLSRFPSDFMFQLTAEEARDVRGNVNSSQIVMSSRKHRGLAYRPYAFTEQGVAMLSTVLKSERAIRVNIEIMRAFV